MRDIIAPNRKKEHAKPSIHDKPIFVRATFKAWNIEFYLEMRRQARGSLSECGVQKKTQTHHKLIVSNDLTRLDGFRCHVRRLKAYTFG